MTDIMAFDVTTFKRHSNPTRAQLGLCSYCTRSTPAVYMVVTMGRSRWALCRLHGRLWRLRRMMQETRQTFENPELFGVLDDVAVLSHG